MYFWYCTHGCVCQLVIKENADDADDDDDDDGAYGAPQTSKLYLRGLILRGVRRREGEETSMREGGKEGKGKSGRKGKERKRGRKGGWREGKNGPVKSVKPRACKVASPPWNEPNKQTCVSTIPSGGATCNYDNMWCNSSLTPALHVSQKQFIQRRHDGAHRAHVHTSSHLYEMLDVWKDADTGSLRENWDVSGDYDIRL